MDSFASIVIFWAIFWAIRSALQHQPNPDTNTTEIDGEVARAARTGNYAKAEETVQRAIRIITRKNGKDDIELAPLLRRLAHLRVQQNDNAGAEQIVQRL